MPDSGSGSMIPIGAGAPGVGGTSLPLPYTLLSLQRYARIMGINPLHFARGETPGLNPIVMPATGCDDIWFKYEWQDNDKVSWWELTTEIQTAEQEIANFLGYWPAPMWMIEESHMYPRPAMREYVGIGTDIRGYMKALNADYGMFIAPGRRTVALVGTATSAGGSLVYSDDDGDGFYEIATITLPTTLTDVQQIKAYFVGKDGDREWEIRDPRSKSISGGFVTIVYNSWNLIEPQLYEDYPTSDGIGSIDVSTTANFVTSVDVYREYTDDTALSSVEFIWENSCAVCGGTGCDACNLETQNGCLHVRNYRQGIVAANPATYAAATGWSKVAWTTGYEPDIAKIWYYAGDYDQNYLRGVTHDPLSEFWAQVIAWLATARLERPLCSCSNVSNRVDYLQSELTRSTREGSYFVTRDVLTSPFGTRRGEVMAYRRLSKLIKNKKVDFALV